MAILDWFSRYVVNWALDDTLAVSFVLEAVARSLRMTTPQIWNTDQGSQFTSPQLPTQIEAAGGQICMDSKGRAYYNIFTERLWRNVKYEEVYLADYSSPREARVGNGQYFQFYNTERPHQALGYRRPVAIIDDCSVVTC